MALARGGFSDDDFFSSHLGRHPLMAALTQMGNGESNTRNIPMDIKETDKAFHIEAELPGVSKQDVKVSVDGDVLSLSISKTTAKEDKKDGGENGVKYHRVERSSHFVQRRVRLPDSADFQKIQAKMDNGILKLDIPKAENRVRQHTINVE